LKFHGPVILNSVQDLTHKGQSEMSPAEGGAGFSMTILEFKKLEGNSQTLSGYRKQPAMKFKPEQAIMDELKEIVVQEFPHRCPYCDQPVSYEQFDLKPGENLIRCPSCQTTFVKVVQDFFENEEPHPSRLRRHTGLKPEITKTKRG